MKKISAMLGILCPAFAGPAANGFEVSANGGLDFGQFKTGAVRDYHERKYLVFHRMYDDFMAYRELMRP